MSARSSGQNVFANRSSRLSCSSKVGCRRSGSACIEMLDRVSEDRPIVSSSPVQFQQQASGRNLAREPLNFPVDYPSIGAAPMKPENVRNSSPTHRFRHRR